MAATNRILLLASALAVAVCCLQPSAHASPNEKWFRGNSGWVYSPSRGPGVLKSTDGGKNTASPTRTKSPSATSKCLTPGSKKPVAC